MRHRFTWTARAVRARVLPAALLLALATLSACSRSPFDRDCDCTTEFRQITLVVLGVDGEPAVEVDVIVRSIRTGRVFTVDPAHPEPGTYVIFDDSFRFQIREEGEAIRVRATKGDADVEAQYLIGTDDCRCHIARLAGPDTVRLQN